MVNKFYAIGAAVAVSAVCYTGAIASQNLGTVFGTGAYSISSATPRSMINVSTLNDAFYGGNGGAPASIIEAVTMDNPDGTVTHGTGHQYAGEFGSAFS